MSNPLVLGKDEKSGKPFEINPKGIQAHTCIVGKSGCGKTTLVARYVEEVVLRGAGNVLLLDYNHEFSAFGQVSAGAFDGKKGKGADALCPEDDAARRHPAQVLSVARGRKRAEQEGRPQEDRLPARRKNPAQHDRTLDD